MRNQDQGHECQQQLVLSLCHPAQPDCRSCLSQTPAKVNSSSDDSTSHWMVAKKLFHNLLRFITDSQLAYTSATFDVPKAWNCASSPFNTGLCTSTHVHWNHLWSLIFKSFWSPCLLHFHVIFYALFMSLFKAMFKSLCGSLFTSSFDYLFIYCHCLSSLFFPFLVSVQIHFQLDTNTAVDAWGKLVNCKDNLRMDCGWSSILNSSLFSNLMIKSKSSLFTLSLNFPGVSFSGCFCVYFPSVSAACPVWKFLVCLVLGEIGTSGIRNFGHVRFWGYQHVQFWEKSACVSRGTICVHFFLKSDIWDVRFDIKQLGCSMWDRMS